MKTNKTSGEQSLAMHVSRVSIFANLLLSLLKLLAGIFAHSGAMISDAVHSASDVFSTVIVIIGIRYSEKAPDKNHPYGHERLECVASILLAAVLAVTGFEIGKAGLFKILGSDGSSLAVPGIPALLAALLSIAVKEWMFRYTRTAAKKLRSDALMADAWHHRSDALSSVGALIGVGGARLGYPVLDPIASLVICLFILKAAWDIFMDAVDKMVDKSCPDETLQQMRAVILSCSDVRSVDLLRTRQFGSRIYAEVEISADASLSLEQGHIIAETVHHTIENAFSDVKHCTVHVNPYRGAKTR